MFSKTIAARRAIFVSICGPRNIFPGNVALMCFWIWDPWYRTTVLRCYHWKKSKLNVCSSIVFNQGKSCRVAETSITPSSRVFVGIECPNILCYVRKYKKWIEFKWICKKDICLYHWPQKCKKMISTFANSNIYLL